MKILRLLTLTLVLLILVSGVSAAASSLLASSAGALRGWNESGSLIHFFYGMAFGQCASVETTPRAAIPEEPMDAAPLAWEAEIASWLPTSVDTLLASWIEGYRGPGVRG